MSKEIKESASPAPKMASPPPLKAAAVPESSLPQSQDRAVAQQLLPGTRVKGKAVVSSGRGGCSCWKPEECFLPRWFLLTCCCCLYGFLCRHWKPECFIS